VITGVVLAAGRSSRLGRPKQLLPFGNEPLLRYTVRRILKSSLDEVLVVVGHEAEAVTATIADLPVRVIVNPDAALGQSTSVQAGLANLAPQTEAVVFFLGDQPGIDATIIDALVAAWRESRAPVVAPRYRDGIGNPVLFDRSAFAELASLDGDSGARPIVREHERAGDLLLVPVDRPRPRDIDTEADYAALLGLVQATNG
jgi:molybdenum cofactor cytidylyltransferase